MKRLTKRLLTGAVSGAMALSLMPATSFGGYEAKAAELTFPDLQLEMLPGDEGYRLESQIWGAVSENEEARCEVMSVQVPAEYADYVWVEPQDEDADGHDDYYMISSSARYDETGETIVNGAVSHEDAAGRNVSLDVSYVAWDGTEGTTELKISFVDRQYEMRCYSALGMWHGDGAAYIPGITDNYTLKTNERKAEWDQEFQTYLRYDSVLENVAYEYTTEELGNDWADISVDGSSVSVSIRDAREEDYLEDGSIQGGTSGYLTASVGGEEVDRLEFLIGVGIDAYGLTPTEIPGLKELKYGGSVIVDPKLTYYNYKTAKEGTEVEDAKIDIELLDEGVLYLSKNTDGTYTIIREGQSGTGLNICAELPESFMGLDCLVNEGFYVDFLDINRPGEIKQEDSLYVVFDDTKARTYTLDTTEFDKSVDGPYEITWSVGTGYWGNGFVITNQFTNGYTVSDDQKSITIDGTVIADYFTKEDENGNIYIDGDGQFCIVAAIDAPLTGFEPWTVSQSVNMKLSREDYSELVSEDPNWNFRKDILPGDVYYLDNFYYYLENEANPRGRYVPFDIQVKEVVRFEDGQPVTDRVTPVEFREVNGRPAITAIESLPPGAAENDRFGESRVEYTYKDAVGEEKTGYMFISVNEFSDELVLSTVFTDSADSISRDFWGSYRIDTLMGATVAATPYVIARKYDRESEKVEVSYPEISSFEFEESYHEGEVSADTESGVYKFNSKITDAAESRLEGNIVVKYTYDWTNGDGSSGVSLNEARVFISMDFRKRAEFTEGLKLDDLNKFKTIEWTPQVFDYEYSEDGEYNKRERSDSQMYGFVYDPETVSVTVDGKELNDSFSKGPFTFTSKSDKEARIVLSKADYNDWDKEVRYFGNSENFIADGIKSELSHDDHIWNNVEGEKAGIGKEGKVFKVCEVGGETVTEVVPAIKSVTLDKTALNYTGKDQTVNVIVKDTEGNVISSEHYTATNTTGKKAGTYKVTVTFDSYKYEGSTTLTYKIVKPVLKYRAYVQKKNWMSMQTAAVSATPATGKNNIAGTTDNLRMETIQMQLSGVGGQIRYRAYCQKKGWVGVGTATGGWATTADKNTSAGTKGESRRVEMIQLQTKGEVSTLYDIYYQAYSEKFGWLAWAGNNEKAGSAGYAYKLEAFRVQLVPKGSKFDKTKGASKKKSFYDKTKDGANPK